VAVDGVVAEVGLAADEPLGEGGPGVVQHLVERPVPFDVPRLPGPELVALLDRAAVEVVDGGH
jgi:hypothetical protein